MSKYINVKEKTVNVEAMQEFAGGAVKVDALIYDDFLKLRIDCHCDGEITRSVEHVPIGHLSINSFCNADKFIEILISSGKKQVVGDL